MKTINKYWKEAKVSIRSFFIASGIVVVYLLLGSFIFFYIEHCCLVIPVQQTSTEKRFIQLCKHITNLKYESNYSTHKWSGMRKICNETNIGEIIKCELTLKSIAKWFKFCCSVIFTVGKY